MLNLRNFLTVYLLSLGISFGQVNNILNAVIPQDIGKATQAQNSYDNDKPLPYGYIDDRDVLWSKMAWEIIDLDERVNFPLYFPIQKDKGTNRMSLFDVIIDNIKNGNITEIYEDDYFQYPKTLRDIEASLTYMDTTDAAKKEYNRTGEWNSRLIDQYDAAAQDVEEWLVKGLWYIDKRQGEMRYRILGICPVVVEPASRAGNSSGISSAPLFWIWYPSIRDILHDAKAFNRKNTSKPISFDQLLNSRRFSATIYKEDNVMGDRGVADYINDNALMQLLESDRIKEQIRNIEIDLWNY